MSMIDLPYGKPFEVNVLVAHIRASSRDYIIQGQKICTFENHPKPKSLDYWLRENYARTRNQKQAENSVLDALVATGHFLIEEKLACPDTGNLCKGIRIV
jgi:hypothetical protein